MELQNIRFAGQRLIESYGDEGFRLTDGRFESSILILPHEVVPFKCDQSSTLSVDLFAEVFAQKK